jgi:hypothetical protein
MEDIATVKEKDDNEFNDKKKRNWKQQSRVISKYKKWMRWCLLSYAKHEWKHF